MLPFQAQSFSCFASTCLVECVVLLYNMLFMIKKKRQGPYSMCIGCPVGSFSCSTVSFVLVQHEVTGFCVCCPQEMYRKYGPIAFVAIIIMLVIYIRFNWF
jgi:hypothetical protein